MGTVRAMALTLALTCLAGLGTTALDTSSAFALDGPAAVALAPTGAGTAVQQVAVDTRAALVAPSGELTTDLVVDGIGSYQVGDGVLTFRPALGFTGAHGVLYRVTDTSGLSSDGTYTPSVTLPSPPAAPDVATSGRYGQPEQCLVAVPEQGRAVLLDGTGQPTLDQVEAAGEFTADPSSGVVTFSPANAFTGPATVGYRVTDAYGQSAEGSCAVTVEAAPAAPERIAAPTPAPPVAARARTRGAAHRQQVVRLDVPTGSSVTLVSGSAASLHVYRPGQGSYALDPASATITFTPSAAFHGTASVTYRLTDAYGRSAQNVYTPTVLAARGHRARTWWHVGRPA